MKWVWELVVSYVRCVKLYDLYFYLVGSIAPFWAFLLRFIASWFSCMQLCCLKSICLSCSSRKNRFCMWSKDQVDVIFTAKTIILKSPSLVNIIIISHIINKFTAWRTEIIMQMYLFSTVMLDYIYKLYLYLLNTNIDYKYNLT